jgi:hypothetical protein
MSSSASVKLRYEKCLGIWGNANGLCFPLYMVPCSSTRTMRNSQLSLLLFFSMHTSRIFWLLALVIAALGALAFAALMGANRVDVVYHDLRATPDLKAIRLVQISDRHIKAFGTHEKGLVSQLVVLQPDVVVLSGDALDRPDDLQLLQSFVKAFAPVPVLLVPGNWEH